ncbi:hypothetical protein KR009_007087 [Drosophila setifemur]|nr:hypothetical protein KR009_007087 [Drosophila setifemur]
MSSQVMGATSGGGAPEENLATEDGAPMPMTEHHQPRQQQGEAVKETGAQEVQGPVQVPSKDSRPANSTRRTGGGQVPSKNQAGNHECQFFFEDEVFRIDRRGRVHFGVVTETAESYSSDEDEDIDEVLSKGEVRVAFYPDGKEMVHTEQSIGLADRTLMPGDVVRRRLPGQKDLTGQAGYVRDVNVCADVKVLGSKFVIRNVPAERLRPISEWTRDVPVCLGTWIGTTVNVDESAVLKSVNGARVEITSNDFHKFKDAVAQCAREVFNPNVYYPGNVVIGRLPPQDRFKNLTPEITLPGNRKARAVYTVESINTTSVNVAWTCRAISQLDNGTDVDPLKQPKTLIEGDDLTNVKRLNLYESYMLQIHDRFYLKYSKCDTLVKYTDWEEEQADKYITIFHRQHKLDAKASKLSTSAASPSASSSGNAGNARNLPKFRRLAYRISGMRLPRPSADHDSSGNASLKLGDSPSATKFRAGNTEETWDSVDDEEDEEDIPEPPESSSAPEKLVGGAEVSESPSATVSTAAAQAPRMTMRYAKRRHMKKKMRSVKKLITSPFAKKEMDPKDGDEIVVETLVVYSSATVVWQDGTVEPGVHSTQLYPIHHLDNHEFFPGDFVSKANENSTGATDYGVIQCVDHDERIAKVKWFNIYSNADNPIPMCKESEELSVYDLKDHSDYQYRPGTMVIRVSNFTGEDVNSTAGQVIDNFPDGRVRVWWSKGHITMCYPQDLFEINHNDQDQDGFESDGSDDSWETQSESSRINMSVMSLGCEDFIIAGLDLAKEALQRLEAVLSLLSGDRKADVLPELLSVYKNCRYLDGYLNTGFFQVDHFQGILRTACEVTNYTCVNCAAHVKDDVKADSEETAKAVTALSENAIKLDVADVTVVLMGQSTSTPTKRKSSTEVDEVQCKKSSDTVNGDNEEEEQDSQDWPTASLKLSPSEKNLTCEQFIAKNRREFTEKMSLARENIAKAFKKPTKNDSGVHSRGENTSDEVSKDADAKKEAFTWGEDIDVQLIARRHEDVCEVFCFLIQDQMAKCRKMLIGSFKKARQKDKDGEEEDDVSEAEEVFESSPLKDAEPEQEQDEAMVQPLNLNALSESLPPIDSPMACSSPSAAPQAPESSPVSENCFQVLPNAPAGHRFIGSVYTPSNKSQYQRAVQREYRMLQASLPPGVFVRAYEDRMDLISVMMLGPQRTPYQNALFFFDFQMGRDFPKSPPVCHYISYCTERLNPNLYEEGKVCVSLLGTWSGRDTEVWTPASTMLQVLVSIQGLILVDEPYYNEAGYEKQRGTQLGNENSRVYNEMAIIKIAHSTVKQLKNPPLVFRSELIEHFKEFGSELHGRMQAWSEYSEEAQRQRITSIKDMPVEYKAPCEMPEFPLLPCSRGFCIAVKGVLLQLQNELSALGAKMVDLPSKMGTAPRAAPEEV